MSFSFVFTPIGDLDGDFLSLFSCGTPDLDAFLVEDAQDYADHGITSTTVVRLEDDPSKPVAFFSLSCDAVQLTGFESGELGLPFDPHTSSFPAVKITKFAVCSDYQRTGLGRELMKYVEGLIFAPRGMSAVRLLTLDALNQEHILSFYKAVGFQNCGNDARMHRQQRNKPTLPMYKDLYMDAPAH